MLNYICQKYPFLSGTGLDINSDAIKKSKVKFPNYECKVFDGLKTPFRDKSFDLAFVSAVIKHIRYEDRERVYEEIKRVADQVFFIEADSKVKEEVTHQSWIFYHSNFKEELSQYFKPVKVVHEAGDILGLYSCS